MESTRHPGDVPESLAIAHVLCMDLVGFSKFSTDAQHAHISLLEEVVKKTEAFDRALRDEDMIRLPTGDGMALVFLKNAEAPARCARQISTALRHHSGIQLRMGINSGPAHPREDIRGGENVVGAGINHAQRAMDCGGAGHILLTKLAADFLSEREEWKACLHWLGEYTVKHNQKVHLYNFYGDDFGNPGPPPQSLVVREPGAPVACRQAF